MIEHHKEKEKIRTISSNMDKVPNTLFNKCSQTKKTCAKRFQVYKVQQKTYLCF